MSNRVCLSVRVSGIVSEMLMACDNRGHRTPSEANWRELVRLLAKDRSDFPNPDVAELRGIAVKL